MRATFDLLRHERRARVYLALLLQSALGTGAGYVALLLIAYDRFESPWAISLVLIAELLPAMLLGPVFGTFADRWSRKWCMVLADALRVVAFAGIVAFDSFVGTVVLAGLAGVGTGLFNPAALAALPSVVDEPRRTPAATSLYGVVGDFGTTGGFALSASLLLLGGPDAIMVVNAVTFAISGLLLARLRFGDAPARAEGEHPSLGQEIKEGVRATVGMRDIRIVLLGSAAGLVCAGLFNVAELLFVTEELGASDAGFSLLVMAFGIGFIGGSLAGSQGGVAATLKWRYLAGLLLMGTSLLATGLANSFAVVALTFAAAGFGNGLLLVYERLLILATVPDRLVGRVFGAKDGLTAWAFGIAFLAGGALVSALGPRDPILLAGAAALAVYVVTALALRGEWTAEGPAADQPLVVAGPTPGSALLDGGANALGRDGAVGGEDGTDVVGGSEGLRLGPLDDSR
ncbi:MAG TPA: MFS transporter [Thermoleophilaceae bacterium]|nr:MFS transporter [Thermoleophilaceae bacterium]